METNKDNKVKESLMVRGVASAIQAMGMPTFENLDDLLKKFGYTLKKL